MPRRRLSWLAVMTGYATAVMSLSGLSTAGDWTLTRGVGLTGLYTDNVSLADESPESDFVTQLSPNVRLSGEGRRVTLDFAYTLRAIHYANRDGDDLRHDLRADSRLELYEDIFFLDVDAAVRQQVLDNRRPIGSDDLNLTGNRTETYTLRASPYLRLRHGNFAESTLRLTADALEYERDEAEGSNATNLTYQLSSGAAFPRTPWGLNYRRRDVRNEDGEDDVFEGYSGQVGYVFNRKWRANASLGWEDNRIARGFGQDQGVTWRAGLAWTPNPRTRASVDYGERAFGETWGVDIRHRTRRSTLGLSYSEDIRTARDEIADFALPGTEDLFSDIAPDVPGLVRTAVEEAVDTAIPSIPSIPSIPAIPSVGDFIPDLTPDLPDVEGRLSQVNDTVARLQDPFAGLEPNLPTATSGTFLSRRLRLVYGLSLPRTNVTAGFSYANRSGGVGFADEDSMVTDLGISRSLGPKTSAQIRGVWRSLESADFDSDELSVRTSFSRALTNHLSTSVYYQYAERQSEAPGDDYQENRIGISLSSSWN